MIINRCWLIKLFPKMKLTVSWRVACTTRFALRVPGCPVGTMEIEKTGPLPFSASGSNGTSTKKNATDMLSGVFVASGSFSPRLDRPCVGLFLLQQGEYVIEHLPSFLP